MRSAREIEKRLRRIELALAARDLVYRVTIVCVDCDNEMAGDHVCGPRPPDRQCVAVAL